MEREAGYWREGRGIPLQVIDDTTGYLVESSEECAKKTLYLLQNSEKIKEMGKAAREHVRENFLITGHLGDYLQLFVNWPENFKK